MAADDTAHVQDPEVLRALAHPLRGRLLGLLRVDGPSTSTRLAGRVGESSGVTSYHLRQLERYGMVAELADRGTKRERWWQAQHVMTSWQPDELLDQPGGREAHDSMRRHQVEVMGRELTAWLSRPPDRAWDAVAGLSDYVVRLTPEQTHQLLEEVYAVLDRWSESSREPRPGTAAVNVFTAAFPRADA